MNKSGARFSHVGVLPEEFFAILNTFKYHHSSLEHTEYNVNKINAEQRYALFSLVCS
jgi:hypothetical protein